MTVLTTLEKTDMYSGYRFRCVAPETQDTWEQKTEVLAWDHIGAAINAVTRWEEQDQYYPIAKGEEELLVLVTNLEPLHDGDQMITKEIRVMGDPRPCYVAEVCQKAED